MGDAAQRSLDAAEHDRHVLVGFLATLAVHQAGAVRAPAGKATRGVGVVGTDFLVRGIAVDHRVHVARSHAEEQVRLAEFHEVVFRLPVRLGNDAHAEALGLQQAADDGHAERRVVDVGITGHDDDVAGIPAEQIHLLPAHRQERCWPEAFGPVLGIVVEWFGCLHVSDRFWCAGKSRARNIAQILTKSDDGCRIHGLPVPVSSPASKRLQELHRPQGSGLLWELACRR